MLALYVAFALQLDQPGWAGTSAVIVAQPVLGAALRKGSFRLLGTLAGAVFSVLLYSIDPESRVIVFVGLALWAAACSFVSSFLREFAVYAAALAGYTAGIIATAAVAAPGDVFLLAVARGSAIAIGIVCTSLVFSVTDLGGRRAELADRIAGLRGDVLDGLLGVLGEASAPLDAQRERRRALVARVVALDTIVDEAIGENFDLRRRLGQLRRAVAGLFQALSSWRGMEQHVRRLSPAEAALPGLVAPRLEGVMPDRAASSAEWRRAGAALLAQPASSASERLLLDRAGEGLQGLADAGAGEMLLRAPARAEPLDALAPIQVSDGAAALVNALRASIMVGAAELLWIATGWTEGSIMVTFTMVVVLLFGVRQEAAFGGAAIMAASCVVALIVAGAIKFAVLPLVQGFGFDGFAAFAIVVGGWIWVSAAISGALSPVTGIGALAFATTANFLPLFSATNEIAYDYAGFLNTALAILAGASFGAAGYRLIPPLSASARTARLLRGGRADLRRLLRRGWRGGERGWNRRLYARLVQLPTQATLQQHAQLLAVLSVGHEVLRMRSQAADPSKPQSALRQQAGRQEIADALASHPAFFAGLPL